MLSYQGLPERAAIYEFGVFKTYATVECLALKIIQSDSLFITLTSVS